MGEEGLFRAINSSVEDLHKRLDRHFDLVNRLLETMPEDEMPEAMFRLCPSRSREHMLKTAIREAIDTLEETRKAFKSKTLEVLRKKLTQILIDLN